MVVFMGVLACLLEGKGSSGLYHSELNGYAATRKWISGCRTTLNHMDKSAVARFSGNMRDEL
jgi:hypothetical protein